MKHLLRKLHFGGGHDDHVDGARAPEARAADDTGSGAGRAGHAESAAASSDQRLSPASAISGWLGRQLPSIAHSQVGGAGSVRPGRESVASAGPEGIRSGGMGAGTGTLTGTNSGVATFGVASSNVDYQSMEEEYQVQLAMAISASNNEQNVDPEILEIEAVKRISLGLSPSTAAVQAEVIAYRYWTYNYLGYEDYVVDGFYDVYGITESTMFERMPSLSDLEALPVIDTITYEVVLVNRATDPDLLVLEKRALALAYELGAVEPGYRSRGLVESLARLVAEHMGGPVASDIDMLTVWRTTSWALKSSIHNIVLPLGRLSIGLARHRALLFKVLADHVGIPSRLLKGRLYTGLDEGALNIVKGDDDREYIVDLVGDPGTLIPPDVTGSLNLLEPSTINAPLATIGLESRQDDGVSSTESHGEESRTSTTSASRTAETSNDVKCDSRSKTAQSSGPQESGPTASQLVGIDKYVPQGMGALDSKSDSGYLCPSIEDSELRSSGTQMLVSPTTHGISPFWTEELGPLEVLQVKDIPGMMINAKPQPVKADGMEDRSLAGHTRHDSKAYHDKNYLDCLADCSTFPTASCPVYAPEEGPLEPNAADASTSPAEVNIKRKSHLGSELAHGATIVAPSVVTEGTKEKSGMTAFSSCDKFEPTGEGHRTAISGSLYSQESVLDDVAEWEILWEDIVMGERIGLGSYGEVYRGDWHGSEVAVKKFLDQDLSGDALEEFRSEVRIMRRLRHPNVVLFMGAVTRAPNLSIVTEFLPRGSLYRLIHRPNNQLDERRRLRMALDVAKGMNYLHSCTPLIVHRDLKSPNLLVDKNWVVKVCDFGLSRMKHHTFLSSKSTAGTPEWMAPEVLRNEPSNEKSDVYSFGVILWELATLQQPWAGMNPMQVVGAVGFQHRRLEIPDQMDPVIARIIRECWQNDQSMRPSFVQLMNALKPLQRPILATQPDSLRHTPTVSLLPKPPQQQLLVQQQAVRQRSARQDVNNRVFPGQMLLNNRLDASRGIAFKDIQLAP